MLTRRLLPLLTLMVGLLIGSGLVRAQPAKPAAEEGPTADQFYLKVEDLIDNVADLDVRRFTLLAQAGKTFKFHIGEAGIGSKGHRTADDKADIRRLEAIVLLRLHGSDDPKNAKIRRLMKFHRTTGNSVESELDAPGRESLAGVADQSQVRSLPAGEAVGRRHGERGEPGRFGRVAPNQPLH
jgi:hypothetical protein